MDGDKIMDTPQYINHRRKNQQYSWKSIVQYSISYSIGIDLEIIVEMNYKQLLNHIPMPITRVRPIGILPMAPSAH